MQSRFQYGMGGGGLPDDVAALKALVIELHERAQVQEGYIKQQHERLRLLAHNIDALRTIAYEPRADLGVAEGQDAAMSYVRVDKRRNGSD